MGEELPAVSPGKGITAQAPATGRTMPRAGEGYTSFQKQLLPQWSLAGAEPQSGAIGSPCSGAAG